MISFRSAVVLLAAAAAAAPYARAVDRTEGQPFATRSVVYAQRGMAASAQPLASRIGVAVLERGGTAVDAAIAVNAALAVLEPVSCGLGGDLFAIVRDPKTGALAGLDASGRSPLALTPDKIRANPDGTIPLYSPYSWTVPGAADGWFELHRRFGRLPMKELLAPAIRLAEEGAPVPQVIAGAWARSERVFRDKPGFAEVFLPGGRAPREGEVFRNPALARTLRLLAEKGRDAYYDGPIAAAIVAYSRKVGGFFSPEDFRRHHSDWTTPIKTTYRGAEVYELPPSGQGLATLEMLNILETFDLRGMGRASTDFWHVFVEAKKLAFADRARYYADPAFAATPIATLLDKEYAKRRAALIDMKRAALVEPPPDAALGHGDTTYLATADAEGMVVSLIQSNYTGFGSGYVVPELGFGLQDRGGQFALAAKHPNVQAPGKRPFHTIIPGFLARGGAVCAFGVMGGATQPQGQAQIVVNLVDFGMNIQEAGDAPRFVHEGSSEPTGTSMKDGGNLGLESGVDESARRGLAARGHRIVPMPGNFGGYQAVCRDLATGVLSGASESRKDGAAIGF